MSSSPARANPCAFPRRWPPRSAGCLFRGSTTVCLALSMTERVVGNDANADRQDLVMVTGANQGGKSTFLRSVGLAQLMMQCGMFVPAEAFCSKPARWHFHALQAGRGYRA